MNKQDYMNELQDKLAVFGDEIKNEIVSDYEEHFRMGLNGGKTEDQICNELGNIDELVDELNKLTGKADAGSAKAESNEDQGFRIDEEALKEAAYNFSNGVNDAMKNLAGFLGSIAASVSKGTGKVVSNVSDSAGSFANNFSSKAEEYAKSFAAGFENAAGKVATKSEEFAKEVSESYHKAMNQEVNKAACDAETSDFAEDFDEDAAEENDIDEKFQGCSENKDSEEECDSVIIETDCGNVFLEASNDNGVHFNYTNNGSVNQQLAYRFNFRQDGKTIYAIAKKQPGTSNFFKSMSCPDIELRVSVPEGLKNIAVRVMSGDVNCEDVSVEQFCISSLSGDVELDNCIAKALEISSMSGDIKVNECNAISTQFNTVSGDIEVEGGSAQTANVKTTSGDVHFEGTKTSDVTGNSVSGDIEVELPEVSGYLAHVKTTCGDVSLNYNGELLEIIRSGSYVLGDGEVKLNISTVSGDISVAG